MTAEQQLGCECVINVSEHESLQLRRLGDNIVQVSLDDNLTGTLTRLAYYKNGTWRAYNAPNFEKLFSLFRLHKHLRPKLLKYLSARPPQDFPEIATFTRVFTCAQRRFIISIKSAHRSMSKQLSK
jgi:hypothetical protein